MDSWRAITLHLECHTVQRRFLCMILQFLRGEIPELHTRQRNKEIGTAMQTIENTREKDVTMIAPDDTEVDADDAQDEFAGEALHLLPFLPSKETDPATCMVHAAKIAYNTGIEAAVAWEGMRSMDCHVSDAGPGFLSYIGIVHDRGYQAHS